MADFTLGRGGKFERLPDNQLVYHPSGREPHIIAGSRTGTIPHAKAYNQKPHAENYDAIFFTRTNIERHMVNGHISYADFYQLFQNEMTYKYYFNLMSDMAANWPFNRADFYHRYVVAMIFQPRLTRTASPPIYKLIGHGY
ncbi:Uncharacterised protein [Weissella viridescens]|uniref:Uncharacterized protein n=1 Tax=Weissella viridescens TaxID=1629 RepID=A0A380NWX2_WEIVI|nr:Uncharacterised protein [Weissella viridescens]